MNRKYAFLIFHQTKLQIRDWYNIRIFATFNLIPLAKLKTKFQCRKFQIEKLRKHYSDSENSLNLGYFAYFSSNYMNFISQDIITLEKVNKKVNSANYLGYLNH